jgi:glycosyltransferase involved in cell wall biosynthesis
VNFLVLPKHQYENKFLIDNQDGNYGKFLWACKKNGWLVPTGDVNSLKIAMQELLNTRIADLDAISEHGFNAVVAQYGVEKEAGKLASLFTGVVA